MNLGEVMDPDRLDGPAHTSRDVPTTTGSWMKQPSATWTLASAQDLLAGLPPASVDMVVFSPPFLGLRSYLQADDPLKKAEIGQESTPGEYLDHLLEVADLAKRVLAPHGSLWVELGDSTAGAGGPGGDYGARGLNTTGTTGLRRNSKRVAPAGGMAQRKRWRGERDGWPADRSLCMVPEAFRFALAYGFNPLTHAEHERWRVRDVLRWTRPNPTPSGATDRLRRATSDVVRAQAHEQAWFNLDALRSAAVGKERSDKPNNPAGVPPSDLWELAPEPSPLAHWATWPSALVERMIRLGCPPWVCVECGEPGEPLVVCDSCGHSGGTAWRRMCRCGPQFWQRRVGELALCDCGAPLRRGRVLDPFAGTGTTAVAGLAVGCDVILGDLDRRSGTLVAERLGLLFCSLSLSELTHLFDQPNQGVWVPSPSSTQVGQVQGQGQGLDQDPDGGERVATQLTLAV